MFASMPGVTLEASCEIQKGGPGAFLLKVPLAYPQCGTPELYDLTLDYIIAAQGRRSQNMEDAECLKMPVPNGLFQTKT